MRIDFRSLFAAQLFCLCACGASAQDLASQGQLAPAWANGTEITATPLANSAADRVLAMAQQMTDQDVVTRGSCYTFIDAIFTRAGYHGWRHRHVVFHGHTAGPYANLDDIQPGDWLFIVNHPEETPVGTHSVLFLGWEDRASGYARVVSYVGGGADRTGERVTYDVSRTFGITRAIDPVEGTSTRRAVTHPRRPHA